MKSLKPKGKATVSQLINNNGNAAANQFILHYNNCKVFQSYETIIAEEYRDFRGSRIILDKNALNYSKTTSKHLFIFLDMSKKEIEIDIKDGLILLKDLNN